ncbi:MAG: adenylate/guanylate cyclase domain-containing protein [Rhodospirillales bacterium]
MGDQPIQRKLAAILYADVAGYSRLTGQDEDATHAAVRAGLATLTRAIEGRGGKVNHYAGDAILAEFGSVVGCVEMAVEVQRRFRDENRDVPEDQQLLFRIGIHMAEVIDDGGEIYGDGVNIAARLEALAEPGGICVTGIVADQVRHRLDVSVEDMGDYQVKNIENPIRAYRIGVAEGGSSPNRAAAEKPAIAVLPFENFSSDPEQEYFSDGIADDIITALSRFGWLQVTARNSTFSYKGQSPDLRDVAKDLNVRYVLEGSVRRAGERVRISVQLIDGGTGNHIWAERYDRELEDIFDLQDEITTTVASAIEPELAKAERDRSSRKTKGNLDAWDLYQRGMQAIYSDSLEDYYDAQGLLRQAIGLSPVSPPPMPAFAVLWR